MSDDVVLQRKFTTVSDGKLVVVKATLGKVNGLGPYFTIASNIADRNFVAEAFSGEYIYWDLKALIRLHMSDASGVPESALDDAWLFARNHDIERATNLLRCGIFQFLDAKETRADLEQLIARMKPVWLKEAQKAKEFLQGPDYTTEVARKILEDGPRHQPIYQDSDGLYLVRYYEKRGDSLYLSCDPGPDIIAFPDTEIAAKTIYERLVKRTYGIGPVFENILRGTTKEFSEEELASNLRKGKVSLSLAKEVGLKPKGDWVEVVAFRSKTWATPIKEREQWSYREGLLPLPNQELHWG